MNIFLPNFTEIPRFSTDVSYHVKSVFTDDGQQPDGWNRRTTAGQLAGWM